MERRMEALEGREGERGDGLVCVLLAVPAKVPNSNLTAFLPVGRSGSHVCVCLSVCQSLRVPLQERSARPPRHDPAAPRAQWWLAGRRVERTGYILPPAGARSRVGSAWHSQGFLGRFCWQSSLDQHTLAPNLPFPRSPTGRHADVGEASYQVSTSTTGTPALAAQPK